MSRLEFNIRYCLFNSVVIVSIIVLIFILIAEANKTGWPKNIKLYKVIVVILGVLFSGIFSLYMFFGVAERDCVIHGVVVDDVVYMSGVGDVFSYYMVCVHDESGSEMQVRSIMISPKKLNNKLSNLEKGDKIDIYYEPKLGHLYDITAYE